MSNTEALRLADALDELDAQFSRSGLCGDAAAELRRLHAENEGRRESAEWLTRKCDELHTENQQLRDQNTELDAACARLEALNAELVEALRGMLSVWEAAPNYGYDEAYKAQALLAKVEGK